MNLQVETDVDQRCPHSQQTDPKWKSQLWICRSLIAMKENCNMWEIVIRSRSSGATKKIVTGKWSRAQHITREAAARGYRASFRRYFTDVLIADQVTGDYVVVATRMDPRRASRMSYDYAKIDRTSGCTLWPHGTPTPLGWRIVRAEA